jgi:rare lipoprotein A
VRVSNPANGKSVVVRVNDRGPFRHDRLIDLSYTAAYKLDLLRGGSGNVVVESIDPSSHTAPAVVATEPAKPVVTTEPAKPVAEPVAESLPAPVNVDDSGFYLQLGAFGQQDNAESFRSKVAALLGEHTAQLNIQTRDGMYRVQLGPYRNQQDAKLAENQVRQTLGIKPVVTQR